MEAPRLYLAEPAGEARAEDDLRAIVRAWPSDELSAEAKLAYEELFDPAKGKNVVTVVYAQFGPRLGASEAAARRWLKSLERRRLARRLSGYRGVRGGAVYLLIDARKIWTIKTRLLGIVGDSQRPLITACAADGAAQDADPGEDAGGSACLPSAPSPTPTAAVRTSADNPSPAPALPSALATDSPHRFIENVVRSTSSHNHRTARYDHEQGTSTPAPTAAPSAATDSQTLARINRLQRYASNRDAVHEPKQVSDVLVAALNANLDPRRRHQLKRDLVAHIVRVVNDPNMSASIPGRAADAVLDYGLSREALTEILRAIAERPRLIAAGKKLRPISNPGAHFYCCIKNACAKAGIGWPPGQCNATPPPVRRKPPPRSPEQIHST